MYLQEDNNKCLNKCLDGYYINNKNCSKCNEKCKTCLEGNKTNENGVESHNCEICLSEDELLIKAEGFPQNCVKECPPKTISMDNKICILKEDKKRKIKWYLYLFWSLIILFALFLFVAFIILLKKIIFHYKSKKDSMLLENINSEKILI